MINEMCKISAISNRMNMLITDERLGSMAHKLYNCKCCEHLGNNNKEIQKWNTYIEIKKSASIYKC